MKITFPSFLPTTLKWKGRSGECSLENCPNTLLMRSLQSGAGVTVGQDWYCSVDCFAASARTRLSALSGASLLDMRHGPRLSLGLAMRSRGYLNDDQLRLASAESQRSGETLDATLLRLELATEKQITAARAAQWGCPVLVQDRTAQRVEADVPPALLRRCAAAPLHYSPTANRLLLGFVYRVEHSLLDAVQVITGVRADPCFVTPTEFTAQMQRLSPVPGREEVVFEEPQTPAQMAKIVGGFALEVAAKQANFARCRDYVWTRLAGKRQTIDVLFRVRTTQPREGVSTGVSMEVLRSIG